MNDTLFSYKMKKIPVCFCCFNQMAKEKDKRNWGKMIEVGERTQNNIEILDGLKEGDKVIVIPVGAEEEEKEEED